MDTVNVFHGFPAGFDVQLGVRVLRVDSEAHFDDLVVKAKQGFANLPPRRQIPARTDGVKPTDYTTVNCSGACFEGDDDQ